jgi:hypothetical protein
MTERRPLGEMLTELLDLGSGFRRDAPALALRSVSVTLPIEVALRRVGREWELLGDVPRTVTRTAFDGRPSRIQVLYVPGDEL